MESSFTEVAQEPKKRGPKPKEQGPGMEDLMARIEALEGLVVRMAHQSGVSVSIILDHGLEPFDPKKGMRKHGNAVSQ